AEAERGSLLTDDELDGCSRRGTGNERVEGGAQVGAHTDAHFHDLRSKALPNGRRQGLSIESLSASATDSSVTTTKGYLRGMEVRRSAFRLSIPTQKRG